MKEIKWKKSLKWRVCKHGEISTLWHVLQRDLFWLVLVASKTERNWGEVEAALSPSSAQSSASSMNFFLSFLHIHLTVSVFAGQVLLTCFKGDCLLVTFFAVRWVWKHQSTASVVDFVHVVETRFWNTKWPYHMVYSFVPTTTSARFCQCVWHERRKSLSSRTEQQEQTQNPKPNIRTNQRKPKRVQRQQWHDLTRKTKLTNSRNDKRMTSW